KGALASLVIRSIVVDHIDDGDLVARHGPESHWLAAEEEAAIALHRDYLLIRLGDLHTDGCARAPSQRAAGRAADERLFYRREREPFQRLGPFGSELRYDPGIALEHIINIGREALPSEGHFVPIGLHRLQASLAQARGVLPSLFETIAADFTEPLVGCHALDSG